MHTTVNMLRRDTLHIVSEDSEEYSSTPIEEEHETRQSEVVTDCVLGLWMV